MGKLLENISEPNPISSRICHCGCGNSFQPARANQIYINKKHADFAYHHNVRKPNQNNQIMIEKHLRLNDRICRKHFEAKNRNEVICFVESLKADGFNFSFIHGQKKISGVTWYFTYNFSFQLFEEGGFQKMKIKKQE